VTVPDPVPEAPETIVAHVTGDTADHVQPACVVTVTLLVELVLSRAALVGDSAYEHAAGAACRIVNTRVPTTTCVLRGPPEFAPTLNETATLKS
jgi:hypothetical protein